MLFMGKCIWAWGFYVFFFLGAEAGCGIVVNDTATTTGNGAGKSSALCSHPSPCPSNVEVQPHVGGSPRPLPPSRGAQPHAPHGRAPPAHPCCSVPGIRGAQTRAAGCGRVLRAGTAAALLRALQPVGQPPEKPASAALGHWQ